MLTDEEALKLAVKHGMKVNDTQTSKKWVAAFVQAIFKEGRDHCVMQIDTKGHVRSN